MAFGTEARAKGPLLRLRREERSGKCNGYILGRALDLTKSWVTEESPHLIEKAREELASHVTDVAGCQPFPMYP